MYNGIIVVNKEGFNGYSNNRNNNMYYNLKDKEDKEDKNNKIDVLNVSNVNIELGSKDYTIEKKNNKININNYIDNRIDYTKIVKKENIRDGVKHLYHKHINSYHDKSYGFFD